MPFSLLRPNPTKIFISYRRNESSAEAGRLSDQLSARFDPRRVFADRESIAPGRDFVEEIKAAVNSCKILLAVIGPEWLNSVDESGRRRLDDPEDFVRLEVATALRRNVRVIPVLVRGASMPTRADLPGDLVGLARRQAWVVSDTHWKADVERLIEKIAGDIKRRNYVLLLLSALALLAVLALGVLALGGFTVNPFGMFGGVNVTPSPGPTAPPTPASGVGETQPPPSPTPTPTPRRTRTPKPKTTTPRTPRAPRGNCNAEDLLLDRPC